jgi:hypothetical protein
MAESPTAYGSIGSMPARESPPPTRAPAELESDRAAIEAFRAEHETLRVRENGEVVIALNGDNSGLSASTEHGKLVLHFWSPERSIVRRVHAVQTSAHGLRLLCTRFGQATPSPLLLESADASPAAENHRDEFRRMVLPAIQSSLAGWVQAPQGQTETPGNHPWQRFVFRRGLKRLPIIAAAENESAANIEAALTELLAWSAILEKSLPDAVIAARWLVVPPGYRAVLLSRIECLRRELHVEMYEFAGKASRLDRVQPGDAGNLRSTLRRAVESAAPLARPTADLLETIRQHLPDAIAARGPDGRASFRLHGLEFARESDPRDFSAGAALTAFVFGIPARDRLAAASGSASLGGGKKTAARPLRASASSRDVSAAPCERPAPAYPAGAQPLLDTNRQEFIALLEALRNQRHPAGDRIQPLFSPAAERWMEEQLKANLAEIEPACDPRYVYSQVPALRQGSRDVLDLLAARRDGRLCVFELKADEDLGFPLQALDYWQRVRHHHARGDFQRLGYFPGIALSPEPPVLYLVAPALRRHPRSDLVLRAIGGHVPIVQLGINEEWRRRMIVVDRRSLPSPGLE